MKKKLIIMAMFILLMLAAIPSAMAACYNHKEVQVSKKAATCTTTGKIEYRCYNCGGGHTETIPKQGHSTKTTTTAATCTAAGSRKVYCTRASCTYSSVTPIAALGHDVSKWTTVRAACHPQGGMQQGACNRCGQVQTQGMTKVNHPSFGATTTTKAATCIATGTGYHYCTACSTKVDVTIPKNPSNHTSFGATTTTKAATCIATGTGYHYCKGCNAKVDVTIPKDASNHTSFGAWTTTATCTKAGTKTHTCNGCKTSVSEPDSALGHKWGKASCLYPAKCTNPGCKETNGKPLGHDCPSVTPGRPACHPDGGFNTGYCNTCKQVVNISIPKANHPSFGAWTTTSTCTTAGIKTHTCTACNTPVSEPDKALGHNHVLRTTTDATCTADGSMYYTCSRCGNPKTETIPKLGHKWGKASCLYPAKCTNPGCKETNGKPLGHDCPSVTPGRPACHPDGGFNTGYCNTCKQVVNISIPKEAHTFGAWTVTKAATCQTKGERKHTCTACNTTIAEPNPNYGSCLVTNWTVKNPACHPDGGYAYGNCSRCGSYQEKRLEKEEHKFGNWVITRPPTCQSKGERVHTCTVCGTTPKAEPNPNYANCKVENWNYDRPACDPQGDHKWGNCIWCGSYQEGPVEKIDHDWKHATCNAPKTCRRCGTTEGSKEKHTLEYEEKAPTETEHGYKTTFCTKGCGYVVEETIHNITYATCQYSTHCKICGEIMGGKVDCSYGQFQNLPEGCTDGTSWEECRWCHDTRNVKILEAPHNYETALTHVDPTCSDCGVDYYQCQDCEKQDVKTIYPINPAAHKWGPATDKNLEICEFCGDIRCKDNKHFYYPWEIKEEASLEHDGIKIHTCKACGKTETEPYNCFTGLHNACPSPDSPAGNHSYSETDIPATCTKSGEWYIRCDYCQEVFEYVFREPTGHQNLSSTYPAGGKWVIRCLDCKTVIPQKDMNDVERAIYQDDDEFSYVQPWEQRIIDESDPDDMLRNLEEGALKETQRRKDELRNNLSNYVPEDELNNYDDADLDFVKAWVQAGNGETDINEVVNAISVIKNNNDWDSQVAALKSQGYSDDEANGIAYLYCLKKNGEGWDAPNQTDNPDLHS